MACPKPSPPLMGLFVRGEDWTPIVFSMPPGPNRGNVADIVNRGGGALVDPKKLDDSENNLIALDNLIALADPIFDKKLLLDHGDGDIFNFQYVLDCVNENRVLRNLKDYRLGGKSSFHDHDPMDIVWGTLNWSDLEKMDEGGEDVSSIEASPQMERQPRQNQPRARSSPEVSSPGGGAGAVTRNRDKEDKKSPPDGQVSKSSLWSVDTDFTTPIPSPPKSRVQPADLSKRMPGAAKKKKKTRRPYTNNEDLAMLDFIVKSNRHCEIGGEKLWKFMEKEKVCGERTWQSMKERFRKQVLPNLDYFDLADSDKDAFKH